MGHIDLQAPTTKWTKKMACISKQFAHFVIQRFMTILSDAQRPGKERQSSTAYLPQINLNEKEYIEQSCF